MKPPFMPKTKVETDAISWGRLDEEYEDEDVHVIRTLKDDEEFMPSCLEDDIHFLGWNFDRDSFDFKLDKGDVMKRDMMMQEESQRITNLQDDKEKAKFIDKFRNENKIE